MISWVRCVLGQSQELTEPLVSDAASLESTPDVLRASDVLGPPLEGRWSRPYLRIGLGILVLAGLVALFSRQVQTTHRLERALHLAQEEAGRLRAQSEQLTQQLAEFQSERQELDERVFSLGVQLSAVTSSLERANAKLAASQDLARQLSEVQSQFETQVVVARQAREEQEAAHQESGRLMRQNAELERSVGRLRQQIALLERDSQHLARQLAEARISPHPDVNIVSSTSSLPSTASPSVPVVTTATSSQATVHLPPIVVPQSRAEIAVPVEGHVVEVNQPHQFIVIDRGSLQGVQEGMVFDLRHGAQTVGRASVIRVRPQLAACNLVQDSVTQPLRVGDPAVEHRP